MNTTPANRNGQELQQLEGQLQAMQEEFRQVLPAGVTPDRIARTVVVSVQNNPALLKCDRGSVLQSAMSAAVLGLEVDGVTGQGYMIPFKDKAQFVVGYKGYETLAARAGYTINSGVVREGDDFDYEEGTHGYVRHKKQLGGEKGRKIIGAWATATAPAASPIVAVMSIDEIEAIRGKAPGAKKRDSPWNDATFYPRMAEKTAIRRLAARMPMAAIQQAAALEDAMDAGKPAHLTPDGAELETGAGVERDQVQPGADELTGRTTFDLVLKDGTRQPHNTADQWRAAMYHARDGIKKGLAPEDAAERISHFRARNRDAINEVFQSSPDIADEVDEMLREEAGE